MTFKLLRGGTVLLHSAQDEVEAVRADVLVRDGIISKVKANLEPVDESCETIDCRDKIISAGFVNTHHHVWQTQLKGLHANQTLLEYLPCGNMSSSLFEPDDVFWGQLAGHLEAVNGGITTVLDFSHINYSPEHVYSALQATAASGTRSIYAYCPTPRAKFSPTGAMEMLPMLEPWIMETFDQLAAANLGPRTSLGFAFDGLYLPKQVLQPLYRQVHAAPNVRVLTTHDSSGSMFNNKPSAYATLVEHELLDPKYQTNWVLAHSNNLQDHHIADLKRDNIFLSITPASELSMGMGNPVPVALNREHDTLASQVSLGVDCHTISEAFIPGQLRTQLFAVRQHTHAQAQAQNQWYASMDSRKGHFPGVHEAFNLATIGGARALGMEKEIGRIEPGYRADLIIWDKKSPSMLAVAEQDPVAAIVIHSQPADVHGVLVDGVVRKMDGRLRSVTVKPPQQGVLAGYRPPIHGDVTWDIVADRILQSRSRIIQEVNKIDMAAACAQLVDAFHLNKPGMLDPVT